MSTGPITAARAEAARKSEAVRFRRALTLLAMTLVLPGSAQLMRGSKAVGRAALRVDAMLVAIALGGFLVLGKQGVVELGFEPAALIFFQVCAVVLGLCWLALFVDAWRLGRPPTLLRGHRMTAAVLSLVLMAGVATPMAWGVTVLDAQRHLIKEVLVPGSIGELYQGRLNILLLGGDGGLDRTGIRTDSISLASVNIETGRTVLFSLPRNMQYVQFPPGTKMAAEFPNGFPDFLYGIYTFGAEHPDRFPGAGNPGALAVQQAVAQTLGVPVHYYAIVNLRGFQAVIDALGGVTINVEERLPIGGGKSLSGLAMPITGWIEPGLQKLNGYRALWYARSRATTTDYDRMARQRCLMGAILREADPLNVLKNYQELAKSAKQVLQTDLTTGAVERLIAAAPKTKASKVSSIQFNPPLVDPANPDIAAIRARVAAAIAKADAPPAPAPTATPGTKKKKKKAVVATDPGAAVAIDDTCKYA
jgi:LCP family protein required for cell wall assembly